MKAIPIMLALALSISLTSYDGNTKTSSDYINIDETTSITMNGVTSDVLKEALTVKSDVNT